jgi:hypothetical protein
MKPPSNVKTPAQYIASLPADRAKTIETVRALVNKHIPRGYDECLVWGTIGWTIPLSRYPDTYNKQPICYVALSSQKNYCSLYLMGAGQVTGSQETFTRLAEYRFMLLGATRSLTTPRFPSLVIRRRLTTRIWISSSPMPRPPSMRPSGSALQTPTV